MPGPALHHLIAHKLATGISNPRLLHIETSPEYKLLQKLLEDKANLPYLFLGCQGPDFLFFNTKDMDPLLGKFVELYFKVYDFIEYFKNEVKKAVPQPILEKLEIVGEVTDAAIEDSALLSSLKNDFEAINRLLNGLISNLTEATKEYIADFNFYDQISHPYRDGVKEKWWWFDALHYRKTGKFAKALLDLSERGTPEHLYALGYLTHVAADTVGHPYVNIIAGGPYRSHAQRHKTAENYQDVYNYLNTTKEDFNHSHLHALYNFNYTGVIKPKEEASFSKEVPDPETNLPDKLAQLIIKAINQVYQEDADLTKVEYGKPMTIEDLNNTYRLWYRWFKSATATGTLPPPVPYSFSKDLREVWEKATDNLGEAGDFIKDAFGKAGKGGLWGILKALAAMVISPVMAAAAIADGIAGSIATLGSSTIRYAACLIYEQLYDAFQNFRLGVAMNGLAFPMTEHLADPRLKQFANPSYEDPASVFAKKIKHSLPIQRWAPGNFFSEVENERHLKYPPPKEREERHAVGAPDSYFNQEATYYAWGEVECKDGVLDRLVSLTEAGATPESLDGTLLTPTPEWLKLGNALQLTQALYQRHLVNQSFPDFNLDADRGYGYLCWSRVMKAEGMPDTVDQSEFPVGIDPTKQVTIQFIP